MSYVSSSEEERREMLEKIGVSNFEELLAEIPESLRLKNPLNIPVGKPELEVVKELKQISELNTNCSNMICFMGGGVYNHYIPAAVDTIISRSEFLTAYTPYQAEVSQGTLQAIYEFQSLVCRLTGMDIANASMYDGASACAEAVLLAVTHTGNKNIYLSSGLHPAYVEVIKTYTSGMDLEFRILPEKDGVVDSEKLTKYNFDEAACLILQSPNFLGLIEDTKNIGELLADKKALYVVSSNPVSLGLLTTPSEAGADLAVGEMQMFGNPLNYGGPYVGYFSAKKEFVRKIPGRIVARTEDIDGKQGYVLTLQTREQHIRRDKATSNICTNQALCALAATVHMSLLGEAGLKDVASQCVKKAHYLADRLNEIDGIQVFPNSHFFNEFIVELPMEAVEFCKKMQAFDILAGVPLSRFYSNRNNQLLICATEVRTKQELDYYVSKFRELI